MPITYLGYITDSDKRALLKNAEAFIYPSWYEGFGLPLLEAMASGCPVITSASSSMTEVIGDAGILIEPHQTGDFSQAINEILNNSSLREDYSTKGKARARLFSWRKTANETYNYLINE